MDSISSESSTPPSLVVPNTLIPPLRIFKFLSLSGTSQPGRNSPSVLSSAHLGTRSFSRTMPGHASPHSNQLTPSKAT